jgi:hypothetical protein
MMITVVIIVVAAVLNFHGLKVLDQMIAKSPFPL